MTEARKIILVTGGAGFVGSHACKALSAAGYQPVVYDNLSRGHREAVKWGPLIEGDILDRPRLEQLLKEIKPAAVMHFAAFAYVGESMATPSMYFDNNVTGTARLLEAMQAAGCRTLVFSSSCAVYGGVHGTPIDESTPCDPSSFYGQTKLNCEQLIRGFVRSYGFSAIALRYFNAAGADPDGEIGENHDPEPHIIPVVLRVAAGLENQVTLNGHDHPTPDGTCVRDFVHVKDLADAHNMAVARALLAKQAFEVFNLSVGQGISLNQIVDAARRVTGRTIPVVYADRRPGDPPYVVRLCRQREQHLGMDTDLQRFRIRTHHQPYVALDAAQLRQLNPHAILASAPAFIVPSSPNSIIVWKMKLPHNDLNRADGDARSPACGAGASAFSSPSNPMSPGWATQRDPVLEMGATRSAARQIEHLVGMAVAESTRNHLIETNS